MNPNPNTQTDMTNNPSKFEERPDASDLVLAAIKNATPPVKCHLAALAWWRIVGVAEQTKNGAELKMKNAVDSAYERPDLDDKECERLMTKAVEHYIKIVPKALKIAIDAVPLRKTFSKLRRFNYSEEECRQFVNGIIHPDVKAFLLAALVPAERTKEKGAKVQPTKHEWTSLESAEAKEDK